MKIIIFGLLFFSLQSPAWAVNIRVIGNGGGEEEMRRLTQLSVILDTVEICLRSGNFCELSPSELKDLGALQRTPDRPVDPTRLLTAKVYQNEGVSENGALALAYLAAVTGQDWQSMAEVPSAWAALVHKIFGRNHWRSVETTWQHKYKTIETFQLVSVEGDQVRAALYSRKGQEWVDLSSALKRALPCPKTTQILSLGPQVRREQKGFSFAATWACGKTHYRGQIMAVEGSLIFHSYGIQIILDSSCQPILSPARKTP